MRLTPGAPSGAVCGAGRGGAAEGPWSRAAAVRPASLGCVCVMGRVCWRLLWAVSEFLCCALSSLRVEQRALVGKELLGLSLPCEERRPAPRNFDLKKHYHQGKGWFLPER